MTLRYDTFPTPLGEFSAAINDAGGLAATAFGGLAALRWSAFATAGTTLLADGLVLLALAGTLQLPFGELLTEMEQTGFLVDVDYLKKI